MAIKYLTDVDMVNEDENAEMSHEDVWKGLDIGEGEHSKGRTTIKAGKVHANAAVAHMLENGWKYKSSTTGSMTFEHPSGKHTVSIRSPSGNFRSDTRIISLNTTLPEKLP